MARRIMLNGTSYFGQGAIQEIVNEIKNRHFKKALVTSTPDLFEFKVATKVTDLLDAAGIAYEIYDGIKPNPTIENVTAGVEACKAAGADVIVAVGGGSPIDTSKAIATIITNPEFADVRSLEGLAPTKNPCLPIIAVTTTSGTAAEVTINYVITDVEKNRKFVCVDPHDIPIVAIVDPDMSASMPTGLCAATGMDALVHAVGQPFLAVSVDKGQLCGGTEGLDSLLRVGDLRDLDRYTVVAGQGDGRLGEALVGQALTDDLLNRVHVVREIGLIIAVRDLCLVNDTGAAYQVKTQTDAVVGVEDARDDRLEGRCSGGVGGLRRISRTGGGVGGSIRAVGCCRVRLRVRRIGLGGLCIPVVFHDWIRC